MDRTRIRWTNVARLLGGLSAGCVLILVVPGLVREPEPPPLPADVGLAVSGTAGTSRGVHPGGVAPRVGPPGASRT